MRVISFNCEGINNAREKGLFDWLNEQDADVICLQDIREDDYTMEQDRFQLDGYFCYAYGGYQRPDRGGVAIYTRQAPKAIISGLGFPEADETGRYLQADFDKISIASLYVPEGHDDESQNFKYRFLDNYSHHLNKQRRKRREFIMAGTWNIAHRKIDVANWREQEEVSGFQPAERGWMEGLLGDMGFHDAYREMDRESGKYSYWEDDSLRSDNMGIRLDYQIITAGMRSRVLNGGIYKNQTFSKHGPVIIDYDWELSL
ncbi:exodeoxyribonuclease III [Endozoicomonas euniceicola]|uniref:Exodeoxyribonuclease III n=1 Tax=Endozoicomonas euniceicola TaxID=1234143 RepID=A0ABY6H1V9_9GAMM|nr:exodeoxyribonuclease III [Endozoicomonas euniceicola]UYM18256.1 exodeoxyribonuclease III [Endozoicomonas euniceicola]